MKVVRHLYQTLVTLFSFKKYSLRGFHCRLAHLATAAGSRVSRSVCVVVVGGGVFTPQRGAFGWRPQRCACCTILATTNEITATHYAM